MESDILYNAQRSVTKARDNALQKRYDALQKVRFTVELENNALNGNEIKN